MHRTFPYLTLSSVGWHQLHMDEPSSSVDLLCVSACYEDSWKGGRGQFGPLGRWLVLQQDSILRARGAVFPLSWPALAALAAQDGIRRASGQLYSADAVRGTWSRIIRRRARSEVPNKRQTATVLPPTICPSLTLSKPAIPPAQPLSASSMPPVRQYGNVR